MDVNVRGKSQPDHWTLVDTENELMQLDWDGLYEGSLSHLGPYGSAQQPDAEFRARLGIGSFSLGAKSDGTESMKSLWWGLDDFAAWESIFLLQLSAV